VLISDAISVCAGSSIVLDTQDLKNTIKKKCTYNDLQAETLKANKNK
jgi:hypothetical protein